MRLVAQYAIPGMNKQDCPAVRAPAVVLLPAQAKPHLAARASERRTISLWKGRISRM